MSVTQRVSGRIKALSTLFIFAALVSAPHNSAKAEEGGLPLHGFADSMLGWSGSEAPDDQANMKKRGGEMGTIDFYLTPEFDGGVRSLLEIAFEPDNFNGAPGVDVERLQVGYTVSDSLTIWTGRFHVPMGVWNTSYHHGAQLQTSIYRPRFIDFEDKGGLIVTHTVGLWAHGNPKVSKDTRIIYDIYASNGPRLSASGLDPSFIRSDREGQMTGGLLGVKQGDLTVGLHGYRTMIYAWDSDDYSTNASGQAAGTAPLAKIESTMMGGFIAFESDAFDFLAEYYSFKNKDTMATAVAGDTSSSMYFAQIAGAVANKARLYARYEKTKLDDNDPYFWNVNPTGTPGAGATGQINAANYERSLIGLRYDVNVKACVKFEYINTKQTKNFGGTTTPSWNTGVIQYAIRF